MASVRLRTLAVGSALALTAGLLTDHGAALGADLPSLALFGIAAGAVLGLVPDRGPAARAAGFLAGFLATWAAYGLRASVLPDVPIGRALAAAGVVAAITAVATATAGRLPLWSGLVGAATLVGAYETVFSADPAAFGSEATTVATTVLLAASIGYLVAVLGAAAPAGADQPPARVSSDDDVDGLEPPDYETDADAAATGSALPAPRVASDAPAPSETSR